MSTLLKKVKALGLPKGEYVVIGSGLLDALGLRESHDIDIVASDRLFQTLRTSGTYRIEEKHNDEVLLADDIEIWRDWKADADFDVLISSAVEVDGEKFANPNIIIKRKTERASPKDLEDIRLLKEHFGK
jgi:hypothetical protein